MGRSDICVCNLRCLEDCAPEAGKLMTVVDLYNVELLHDARVQAHFFCLKAREDLLAKVDSNAIVKLLLALKVPLVLFKFALNSVDVA